MSKYGLQLRVNPSQKKQPTRAPLPNPLGFHDEDDNDVEGEISRQASKNKALKDIEEQHKKALEEDPSVFDYDAVYDEMKEKAVRPQAQDREERKPKYIENLIRKAEERKRQNDIIYERKLVKERSKEDHLYADKDKFVTSAYKKKLEEQAKWMEEERRRELREEKDDVTKKSDLSEFYFNLGKNVAFGAKEAELRKSVKVVTKMAEQQPEIGAAHGVVTADTPTEEGKSAEFPPLDSSEKMEHQVESSTVTNRSNELSDAKPSGSKLDKTSVEHGSSEQLPNPPGHHKRNEDAISAAKQRFLARKRLKEQ